MLDFDFNANALLARLQADANRLIDVEQEALERLGNVVAQDVEREIGQGAYNKPIPSYGAYYKPKTKYRAGTNLTKPAWKRTNALINGVAVDKRTGEVRVFIQGEAGKPIPGYPGGYAERLGSLPSGRDGVNRSNPFFLNAIKKHEAQWKALFEQDVINAIGLIP